MARNGSILWSPKVRIDSKMPTSQGGRLRRRLEELQAEIDEVRAQLKSADQGVLRPDAPSPEAIGATRFHVFESAIDGMILCDGGGLIRYMNLAAKRMLGLGDVGVEGSNILDFIEKRQRDELEQEVSNWLSTAEDGPTFLMVEIDIPVRGLSSRLNLHIKREVGPDGGVHELMVFARDVTEQSRLQNALLRSEEHYRGIIENMELGILEVDNQERIVRAFPKFCDIVGYTEDELLGRKASEVFMPVEDRPAMDKVTDDRNSGQSGLYEVMIRDREGEQVWLLISGVPIRDEQGQVVGSMGIHYDITERKRNEQRLEQAMRDVREAQRSERQFLAKMSHEIRTPMNAVIGMARLLSDTELDEDQSEFVHGIIQGGGLLKELLNDILDVARLEEGRYSLTRTTLRLKPLFEGVEGSYRMLLGKKGVALELMWSDELDVPFRLDKGALVQVLLNLVGNAVKFTDAGKVTIRPRLMTENGRTLLEVAVCDTGRGIPAEECEAIFNRFQQLGIGRDERREGSGLGLSIVKELCVLHGGEVKVESSVGVGSTFTFTFAVEKAGDANEVRNVMDPGKLMGKRVLFAEDNDINAMYLSRLLKKWGVVHVRSVNGRDVVSEWRQAGPWDMILMDVEMPLMTGIEATRKIREEETGGWVIPIIGLSAYSFHKDVEEGFAAGMSAYLKKPYSPEELMDVLLDWC